ncbi:MAG: acetolactate synthase small subunit [Clostridiales bacterium]|jgi:acetolactate synthase-1/3 small subunit|nr:acetolactate synthase small subunit [Clostridiales bacterium]
MDKHTISILVDNQSGVLVRVASLFSRRGFNIESLAVGATHDEEISRITVLTYCDQRELDQIASQLSKLVCVRAVQVLPPDKSISRELLLIKVKTGSERRTEVMLIATAFRAHILDVARETMTLELTGESSKISALIALMADFGILETMRTGIVALERDAGTIYHTLREE